MYLDPWEASSQHVWCEARPEAAGRQQREDATLAGDQQPAGPGGWPWWLARAWNCQCLEMPKKRMALNGGKNMEKPIETWWFTKFINLNHQTWRYIDSRFRHHYTFWIGLSIYQPLPTCQIIRVPCTHVMKKVTCNVTQRRLGNKPTQNVWKNVGFCRFNLLMKWDITITQKWWWIMAWLSV